MVNGAGIIQRLALDFKLKSPEQLYEIWYTISTMTFKEQVLTSVHVVPKGKVVSYGQIAAACGSPRAARQVGWILHGLDGNNSVPWWRVINNLGQISIKGNFYSTPLLQKKLLIKEKVRVTADFKIDIEKYRFTFTPMALNISQSK